LRAVRGIVVVWVEGKRPDGKKRRMKKKKDVVNE
jgi:hypothetical protein